MTHYPPATQLAAIDFDLEIIRRPEEMRALLSQLCSVLSRELAPHNLSIRHRVIETPGGPVDMLIIASVAALPAASV